ncbi:hypothetical protein LTR56_011135 [Elasticomyces elasticus]|nr:hypothetical protein LTR56_011135 [Elasticomyces elasticus]KAK3662444.1 hypothetical protein LTR22_006723 [Elasticomyces elasticus]KAK4926433.1 hypothetical protein LTR49_006640 [Elasticomyces elasticus]KAK5761194.1 hypothetical protein LTS12_008675 [Elasticomyces elasticus]
MAYNAPQFPPNPSYTSASTLGAPPGFVPPTNWNAPTVRFTPDTNSSNFRGPNAEPLGNGNNPRRSGLGAPRDDGRLDRERQAVRESMAALQPPTREEVARTIFVGGLGEGCPNDEALEEVLRCAGKLRRWTRARDADDRVCKFGFAEYEDVDSLDAANVIFEGGVEVPVFSKDGGVVREGDAGEVKTMKLLIVVDEASRKYIQEWKGRGREDEDARQFRLDGCREDLRQCVTGITNAASYTANNGALNGDTAMINGTDEPLPLPGNGITLPGLEDELSDIPAEMRATVAGEIRAFRDRSTRRDLERMKVEEAMGASERREGALGRRPTPPPDSIPSGPRGQNGGIRGGNVPQGPRARGGAQLPSDYQNGVTFVGANGGTNGVNVNREDEDAEESDDELERKRQTLRTDDLDRQYQDLERKHLNRERQRNAALAREKTREDEEGGARERENDMIRVRLAEWDDEEEVRLGREEYYSDRAGWLRKRGMWRAREEREDERDRRAEEEERVREAGGEGGSVEMQADAFLEQTGAELLRKTGPAAAIGGQGVKISLGSAAARQRGPAAGTASAVPKRGMAEIESLLEDEEDAARQGIGKRTLNLKPIADLPHTHTHQQQQQDLSDSERAAARQALAAEIPTTTAELFATPLNYTYLTPSIIENEIRPFVVKKVVEYLGVQEDLLVDTVVGGLRERKGGMELVESLEGALEEEAEVLVRRVWRLGVFWGEAGARGLN